MPKKSQWKKRPDGHYEAKVALGVKDDGRIIRKSVYAKTINELEKKIKDLKEQNEEGTLSLNDNTLISEYCRNWFDLYKSKKETNTRAMYKNIIEKHIIPCIGELRIKQLKKYHIQAMINSRYDKPRTCQQIVIVINQVIQEMKADRCMSPLDADVITKNLSLPKYRAKEKRALTKRELEAIIKADFTDREKSLVYTLFYFGLRKEEALGLMKNDFDFVNNKLRIQRAIIFDGNKSECKGTKSFAGERSIDIPAECRDFFQDYLSSINTLYLFTKLDGTAITKSSYDKMWKDIIKKMNEAVMTDQERSTGIKPIKLTAHYFRHNYCTILYYSGLSVGKAVELMGHADYKMIMNVYKHLDDEKECTIEKINNNVRLII